MRTDPEERMRRPDDIELPEFWDKLEDELRDRIRRKPPRPSPARFLTLVRAVRSVARPALHGAIALMVAAVLVLPGTQTPNDIGLEGSVLNSMRDSNRNQLWVAVVEVPDPQPAYTPGRLFRAGSRFVNLIPSTAQASEPVPEPNLLTRV